MTILNSTESPQTILCEQHKLSYLIMRLNDQGWYVAKGVVDQSTNQIALKIIFMDRKEA